MFITVRRFEIHDESLRVDEVADRVRNELIPKFEEIEGFREYFLIDSANPPVMSVTVCDDQHAAEAVNRTSQAFVNRAFKRGSVERVDLTQGEVVLAPAVIGHM